jgi:hypothetical protein
MSQVEICSMKLHINQNVFCKVSTHLSISSADKHQPKYQAPTSLYTGQIFRKMKSNLLKRIVTATSNTINYVPWPVSLVSVV